MHNVELIAESMRSGAALSAISAEQRLSYVPLTYPPKPPPAPSRWRALVDRSALRRSGRCNARYSAIRSALMQTLARSLWRRDGRPRSLPAVVETSQLPAARAPRQGEHTEAVLREAGASDAEISALRAAGVVR